MFFENNALITPSCVPPAAVVSIGVFSSLIGIFGEHVHIDGKPGGDHPPR